LTKHPIRYVNLVVVDSMYESLNQYDLVIGAVDFDQSCQCANSRGGLIWSILEISGNQVVGSWSWQQVLCRATRSIGNHKHRTNHTGIDRVERWIGSTCRANRILTRSMVMVTLASETSYHPRNRLTTSCIGSSTQDQRYSIDRVVFVDQ
jgi:hypothetical protein